jgi:acetyl-CoA carboxylase biotin carboxylase subunit
MSIESLSERFGKVLVANRGEIAIRVIRALRESGVQAVAVYSEADRASFHLTFADEAYCIGPASSTESYLHIDRIVEAARRAGVDAIHPGYGFLSENPRFARACREAGITFIGPPPEAMEIMGNKVASRRRVGGRGIPPVPGGERPVETEAEAAATAREIGYPVLLKAAAGGGGKGMRIVGSPAELSRALDLTRSEASKAFGDDSVFVEKYITDPRHIEVQILADDHGNVIHLGERECSVQRRWQKIIEECPSAVVDAELRGRLGEAAVEAARAVGYRNAGTVEFVMDASGEFYFLEMNTRLQVEHPVTEMVTRVDLVRQQLRIAAGLPISLAQEDVTWNGHAMEFRIYAEDPDNDFLPSVGTVQFLNLPEGPGVRNDHGIYQGCEVSYHYDPLLGKLIVWAENRERCLRRAVRALSEYQIYGVATNLDFHLWAVRRPEFIDATYDTRFVDTHWSSNRPSGKPRDADLAVIAAALRAYQERSRFAEQVSRLRSQGKANPWKIAARRDGLRRS